MKRVLIGVLHVPPRHVGGVEWRAYRTARYCRYSLSLVDQASALISPSRFLADTLFAAGQADALAELLHHLATERTAVARLWAGIRPVKTLAEEMARLLALYQAAEAGQV